MIVYLKINDMKIRILFILLLGVGVMFSCDKDEDVPHPPVTEEVISPIEGDVASGATEDDNVAVVDSIVNDVVAEPIVLADLTTFDFGWQSIAVESFVDVNDVVPTSESHALYDDYVENSEFNSVIKIIYSESGATVEGAVEGVTVSQDGAFVTVNSTVGKVEYILSGATSDGGLKVYSEKKLKLSLAGVDITNSKGAAINIQSKKRIFVDALEGTLNSFTDAASYTTPDSEDEKACIFAEGQMIFSGKGEINVNANYKHAICSDDYIVIRPGTNINVLSAVKDGIHSNGQITFVGGRTSITCQGDGVDCEETSVVIEGGLLKVQTDGTASKCVKAAGKITMSGGTLLALTTGGGEYDSDDSDVSACSCMKCDSALTISGGDLYLKSTGAGGKGMSSDQTLEIKDGNVKVITTGKKYTYSSYDSSPKGIKADGNLTISGGTVMVRTTGGEGSEGIESKAVATINGGDIAIHSYDDAINASSNITFNGGNVYCYATNNDGIDSNGTINVAGGLIVTSGSTTPEGSVDCDNNQFKVTGGTLLGIGGATSKPTTNVCTQNSLVWGSSASADTRITICKSDGAFVMSYVVPRAYSQGMTLLFSSALMTTGSTYNIYTGGTVSGGTTFNGLTLNGTFDGGTQSTSFTVSSALTSVGNTSSGPGGGGPGGRW